MAAESRTAIKTYFNTGDKPTEAQFVNLIDSGFNLTDDTTDDITEGDNKFVSAAELSAIGTIGDKQDKPTQATTFDDSGAITVATTVQYSTVRTVTGSTHTLTAATVGNVIDNYKLVRYTFDVDCNLLLTDFDDTGSTLGTVNPIPAGTYNFWFFTTAFGVGLVIQNNTGTTPGTLSTPVIVLSAGNTTAGYIISGIDANATVGSLELSTDNATWASDEDYSFAVTTGMIDGLTNGVLYYVRFRVSAAGYLPSSYATGTVTPSVAIVQLTAPTISSAAVVSSTIALVTTNDPNTSPQETTVLFRMADDAGMTTNVVTSQQTAGTLTHQFTGLTEGNTYYFDVIHQGDGLTTSDSAASSAVSLLMDVAWTTFNGTTNHVYFGNILNDTVPAANAKFAIEYELKEWTIDAAHFIMTSFTSAAGTTCEFNMYFNAQNEIAVLYQGATYDSEAVSVKNSTVFTNTAKKVRIEYDGSIDTAGEHRLTLYVNGSSSGTWSALSPAVGFPFDIANKVTEWSFGAAREPGGTVFTVPFDGKARNLKVQLYTGGVWVDKLDVPYLQGGNDISSSNTDGTWV